MQDWDNSAAFSNSVKNCALKNCALKNCALKNCFNISFTLAERCLLNDLFGKYL